MKRIFLLGILMLGPIVGYTQTCEDLIESVKDADYGTTYNSYTSEAISSVSFHEVTVDYSTYYFAIVCFKREYYGCDEYIYQVSSNTEYNYSTAYLTSAGKAFWKYIQPYHVNLECSPDLD